MARIAAFVGCFTAFVLSSCDSSFDDHMAVLEEHGIAQRDCVPSGWFQRSRPDIFGRITSEKQLEVASETQLEFTTSEASTECNATRRLVRELRDEGGLFRTYRCNVGREHVEVSFSSGRSAQGERYSWCEFAYSRVPFESGKEYTAFVLR
jgi:Zn ribbon nucleic-acid-binding protein